MNPPAAPIAVRVRATNPGQFLACCGLLELADRLAGGAEGWFTPSHFFCTTHRPLTLQELLETLVRTEAEEVTQLANGLTVEPLIAPLRLHLAGDCLLLDAWMTIGLEKNKVTVLKNPPWNFWSGQQTTLRIWRALREALQQQLPGCAQEQLFSHRIFLRGRFGFDPGAAWNALDVGFSLNEQGMEMASSPAVELLAAVGLQRFRPALSLDRQTFIYNIWECPLAPAIAAAVAADALPELSSGRFRGRVISRGSYAALGYATRYEEAL
jgi:CRISPR-associated protein Csx14